MPSTTFSASDPCSSRTLSSSPSCHLCFLSIVGIARDCVCGCRHAHRCSGWSAEPKGSNYTGKVARRRPGANLGQDVPHVLVHELHHSLSNAVGFAVYLG